jgi:SAM-dependent methyltransferase
MAEPFHDHFSGVAAAYRAFRPVYPPALFEWLAALAPARDLALDCGCGTGQASAGLAERFARVLAVDPSADLVAKAVRHPRIDYRVARAEETGAPAGAVDLVVAAQAYHWFDAARFHREVARVARPGAGIALVTYGLCQVDAAVDEVIDRLYRGILAGHWPPERAHVDAGYRTLPFPWPEVTAPPLDLAEEWALDRFEGYLATWSAVTAYRRATGRDPVAEVARPLRAAWGDPAATRRVAWPLAVRAGRVTPEAAARVRAATRP